MITLIESWGAKVTSNNETNFERRNNDWDISSLFQRLEEHFGEEAQFRQEFSGRVSGIEHSIDSMNNYIQRITEILERITIIEERDKSHNKIIDDLSEILKSIEKQVQANKDSTEKKIDEVDRKTDKWLYTLSGAIGVVSLIVTIFGSYANDKIKAGEELADRIKIHLEMDKPTGWPPVPK